MFRAVRAEVCSRRRLVRLCIRVRCARPMPLFRLLSAGALGGALGCGDNLLVEAKPVFAAVFGVVSSATGAPIPGARVVAASFSICGGTRTASMDAATDAAGHYRIRLTSAGPLDNACIRVTVTRSIGAVQDSSVVDGVHVTFAPDRATGTEDSVRVDVRFP